MIPVRRAVLATLVVVALVAGACTSAGDVEGAPPASDEEPVSGSGPRNGGRLVVAVGSDPVDLDPAGTAWDTSTLQVARGIYDRLAVYDEAYRLTPELAESIEANADFTEWSVTVRAGVVFHDGTPVDAEALRVNLEAQRQGPASVLLHMVESVFVTGPRTVSVRMRSPWSTFPDLLTTQAGFVASPALWFTPGGRERPTGTGAFVLGTREPGRLTLTKNSSYWRQGLPRLDEIDVRVLDDDARAEAVSEGRVDVALLDDPAHIADLRSRAAEDRLQVMVDTDGEAPKLTVVLNAGHSPFIDFAARQALGFATDRVAMAESGFDGLVTWVRGPVSDTSLWYNDPPVLPHDPAQAAQRLASYQQRYGTPLAFTALVPAEPVALRYAALWQRQLAAVDVDVQLDIRTMSDVQAATTLGDFDAAFLPMFDQWHPDLSYPAVHLSELTPVGAPGPNLARMGSLAIDEALDAARATNELADQVDAYRTAQNELVSTGAYLFLVRLPTAVVADVDVHDLTRWSTTSGVAGLPVEGGTVSLTEAWLDRPERPTE